MHLLLTPDSSTINYGPWYFDVSTLNDIITHAGCYIKFVAENTRGSYIYISYMKYCGIHNFA